MERQRRRDTAPERALRSELHRRGLRFRVDRALPVSRRRVADVVFTSARVAVFVDGCFWHGCPEHGTMPRSNRAEWRSKLARNQARDRETDALLVEAGWVVVRVWEHEPVAEAADKVQAVLADALRSG
jgi:DNA mismatch endonuclease (patch repair protein)